MSLKSTEQIKLGGWTLWEAPFLGYNTRFQPSLQVAKKFFSAGQNMSVSENGSLTVRQGSSLVGAEGNTSSTPIRSSYTFKRRDGIEIEMRTFGTRVEYRNPDLTTPAWDLLQSVTTTDLEFGFATININANATSRLYFCNGSTGANDDLWRWNGTLARIASTTATTITKQGTTTFTQEGFSASGTVIINGTQYTYSGGANTTTLTGVSGDPTGEAVGEPITEIPVSIIDPVTYTNTVGNILLADGSRLLMAGITGRESTIRFSEFANPENFGARATPTDPSTVQATGTRLAGDAGLRELPEGGGGVIALLKYKDKQILAAKTAGWTKLHFTDAADNRTSGTTNVFAGDDLIADTLYSHDGKSQVVGAVARKLVFAGNNGIFAVTQDKRILFLTEIENILTPTFVDISDGILPTLRQCLFNRGAGIFFEGKAHFSCRSDSTVSRNDTVFVYDINSKTWELPWVGVSAGDWTILTNVLRWGSDQNDTSWRQNSVDEGTTDNTLGFSASVTTHADDMGVPHKQKTLRAIWLEGSMTTNTRLEVELLYDRGITSIKPYVLLGTDEEVFSTIPEDAFGLSSFGKNVFGSAVQQADLRYFKYLLVLQSNLAAFDYSLRITSTTAGANFQIDRFGFQLDEVKINNRIYQKA